MNRRGVPESSGTSRDSSPRLGPAASAMVARSTLSDQGAQRLDDRAEREAVVAERDRAPLEGEPAAVAQSCGDLADKPALADPGLTTDEDDRGNAGRGEIGGRKEPPELLRSADENGAGQASRHRPG